MQLSIVPMNQTDADAIVAWRYAGEYAFYDLDADPDDLADFLKPAGWGVRYFAAHDKHDELIGTFHFVQDDTTGTLAIGLGMRPDLTGRGLGQAFLEAGLAWAQARYAPQRIVLAVANFNTRAICVYERVGFRQTHTYLQQTNGGTWDFIAMELDSN